MPGLSAPQRLLRGAAGDRVMPRELAILACTECGRRNYTTTRNKRLQPNRIEIKKFCRFDRKHTPHKEVK